MKIILSTTILALASFTAMANTNTPVAANHKAPVVATTTVNSLPFPICNDCCYKCGGPDLR